MKKFFCCFKIFNNKKEQSKYKKMQAKKELIEMFLFMNKDNKIIPDNT